jgi:hypothetical protein
MQDFEFLYGQWLVRNRRLRQRLVGCNDWDVFDSMQRCWPLLDGLGNVDEFVCDDCGPLGATLRFFDPQSRRWTLHWVSSRDGALQPPVQGAFRGPVGEFYGEDEVNGKPVLVRYLWTRADPEAPRWEQAFSADGGASWETNWVMEFSRLDWPFEAGLLPDRGWDIGRAHA